MSSARVHFLAFILGISFTGAAFAQRSGLGIKAGPQLNSFRAINIRTTMTPGFSVGLYAPIGAAPRLELQPEILLSMMGTGFIEPDGDRYSIRSIYVHAPVSAKYFLNNEISLQGGVQLGKLMMAHRIDADGTTSVRDKFKTFDMGFTLGLGYDLRSGMDITLRYYSGMPTLLKDDDALFPRSRCLQLTVGKRLMQMKKMGHTRFRK